MFGELARDEGLSAEQEIMHVMKSTLDRFPQEMVKRVTRLKEHLTLYRTQYISWKLSTRVRLMSLSVKTVRILERSVTLVSMEPNSKQRSATAECAFKTHHNSESTTPLELLSFIV